MDEVSDPSMSVLAEGFFFGGLKLFILYVLYKIKDASSVKHLTGEKNNTYVSSNWLAQVKDTGYSLYFKSQKLTNLEFKRAFHTKIRASMNLGLTDTLSQNFPGVIPQQRPENEKEIKISSPYWFTGFVDAEGCFWVSVKKSKSYKIGYQTQLWFVLVQHIRDEKLFEYFKNYFDCGKIQKGPNSVYFSVTKFKDLEEKIIPFFQKYPLLGSKYQEYLDFIKIYLLVKNKSHLTELGLNQIREIKLGMNRGRDLQTSEIIKDEITPIIKESPKDIERVVPVVTNSECAKGATVYTLKNKSLLGKIHKREFHAGVRASKRIGPHPEEIISCLVGCLLGNSHANSRTIEGVRFKIITGLNYEYAQWLYEFYLQRGYCSNLSPRKYTRRLKGKEYYGYEFNTFTFRSFNWIHKLFYKKGVKYINPKLELYLTPLALAVLIMDDGCWTGNGVRIATNCFKLEEVKLLANMLVKLYHLNYSIQNIEGNYSIYITKDSIPKLRNLLLPYIIPSMKYKLGIQDNQ